MKRTTFMVLAILLWIIPSVMFAQTSYDVSYKEQTVEQVIKDLRQKTGYQFVYKKEILADVPLITCTYKDATLIQLLDRIFYDIAGLDYEISKGTVILKKASKERPFFKKLISGIVRDENDENLIGVTVRQKGTNNGIITDLDGNFVLMVEGKNPVLEFSYVGMKTKAIEITPRTEKYIMVRMEADQNILDEVLVTGYQNIKRENATGAYQLIGSEEFNSRHTADIVSRLEGQIPGLTVYNNGKNDGGEDAMTIRGVSSFQAKTSPLIVVDGLPIEGSIETVNPYDVENITVLKDASAAAIYGARASNGVIVITTKRGHSERLSIDFNADLAIFEKQSYSNRGWASAAQALELEKYNFDYVTSRDELYETLLGNYGVNPGTFSPATRLLLQHRLGEVSDSEFNTTWERWSKNDYRREWRDAMLRNQIQQQYNLAVRSKGKYLNSNIVVNYKSDNNGIYKERSSTWQLSYQGDINIAKWMDLSVGLNVISEHAKMHADRYGFAGINSFHPYLSMYNADGSWSDMQAEVYLKEASLTAEDSSLKSEAYNLLRERDLNFTNNRRTNIRSYAHVLFKILPELNLSARFQYEDISFNGDTYYEADSYAMRHYYNMYTSDGIHYIPEGGMLDSNNEKGDYYTFRTQANYTKTFKEKHEIDAIAGFEYRQTHTTTGNNILLGYDNQTQTNMNHLINFNDLTNLQSTDLGINYVPYGAPKEEDFATSDVLHRFYSLYFNGSYIYDRRYSLSLSYRVDKADLFGADPEFRGRPLWSVGASWNLHNEAFMKPYEWIDVLKLRGSYGLTGNIDQSVSSYLTASIFVNDLNGQKRATLDTPPNDQLRWEKTTSWNIGVDFSFFNNRLSGSLDYYHKVSDDLLSLTDIDPTTGWSSLTINNGKVRNQGVELQLNGTIIEPAKENGFGVNASFNISYNNNKVLRVDHKAASGYDALSTLHEGYPINSLYSYRYAGMVTDDNDIQYLSWKKADGTISTSDITSTEFTVDDVVFSGGLDPKVVASFTPELTWNNFSLSALFAFYGGHYMRAGMENWTRGGLLYGYDSEDTYACYLDYWNSADKSTIPANGYIGFTSQGTSQYIDQTVVPADYLKLRSITLGYRFPKRICNLIGVQGLGLRVQMNNVATWVRNDLGIDPEACDPVSGYAIDKTPRSYIMSLNVNF